MAPGRTSVSGQESVLKPGSRRLLLVGGLILATVMTACAAPGSATPSASTAPSEEPTPSSTPFDVVSAFVGELADGVLGRATISGTLEVGSIHATLGGSYAFGLDNATRYEVTTTIGDSRTISRTIAVAGTTYTQQGEGPWLVQEPGSGGGSSGIEAAFAQIARLKDVGIVTWNGREVHSLQVPGGLTVPPAALGIADPSVQDPHAVVGFYALDDGTPAGMEMTMTWTQETGGAAVTGKMVMDVVFVHLGTAADIEPPEDVWQTYTSKTMNFSVAYPGDWSAEEADATSVSFMAPDESAVIVMGIDQEDPNLDQASFEADLLAGFTDHFGVRADAVVPLVVAGASIHAYEFHVTWDGDPTFVIFAPVVVGGKGYQIAALSMPGYEDDDRAAFRTFLNTVAFAG